MGKIICPECKSEIDNTNKQCPNCGFPLKRNNPANIYKIISIVAIIIIICLVGFIVIRELPSSQKTQVAENNEIESNNMDDLSDVVVDDDAKGGKNNPYSIGEKISINDVEYEGAVFDINMTINSYSKSSNLLAVSAEITRCTGSGTVYPFEVGSGIFIEYVDSNYSLLGYALETTDKSDLDMLSENNIGLFSGGRGETYFFSYNEDEWNTSAEYAVILVCDNNHQDELYYWVKLH